MADVPESRLFAQAIPTDPALWEPVRFRDFMKERRRLLAAHMNEALKGLASPTTGAREPSVEPREATTATTREM